MNPLYLDTETYSTVPIERGLYRYAEAVEVMAVQWAWGDGPVHVWDRTADTTWPENLDLAAADQIVIHNAPFDMEVLRAGMNVELDPGKVVCTMAQAYAHSLPGSLDALCNVLQIPQDQSKIRAGRNLIHRFCKPGPGGVRSTRETHPALWAQFLDYARQDIVAGREVFKRLPAWNYPIRFRQEFVLDLAMNRRGFALDTEYITAAVAAVEAKQKGFRERTVELTEGELASVTQRDATLKYIQDAFGLELPDLRAATVEKALKDPDLPDGLKELLILRQDATTTSTAKYKTLLKSVNEDGRLRGTLQLYGASRTGRWAGRVFQPHNLPRPALKQREIEQGVEAIKLGVADLVVSDLMPLTSSALRGVIVASKGKKLFVSDWSNIEGRGLAWLAGEQWVLDAFAKVDAGDGWDLYISGYAKTFRVAPETVTDQQRQVGKVMELALGYEGGVAAFLTFAAVYGLDLDALAKAALGAVPQVVLADARGFLSWAKKKERTFGLKDDVFVACESLKRLWRAARPKTVQFWSDLNNAFGQAVAGQTTKVGEHLTFEKRRNYVLMTLPSGRHLCYPAARVTDKGNAYLGVNQFNKKWGVIHTYGGKLAENATQAAARDILAEWLDRTKFTPVLHVHDEAICEQPDTGAWTSAMLEKEMSTPPWWAPGLPLHAKGFESYRYKKG